MERFPEIEAPDWGLSDEARVDVDQVQFGDGYQLRRRKGINSVREGWTLSWSALSTSVAKSTHAWLKARQGMTAFEWVHPVRGDVIKVVCTTTRLGYNNFNDDVLTATFVQDFNPA